MCQEASPSDEDLIERYYACDDMAYAELFSRYHRRLVAYFRRWVPSEDAEDLAQFTFLRVVRTKPTGRGRYDPSRGASFRTWLFVIARREVVNAIRSQPQLPGREAEEGEGGPMIDQTPAPTPSADEILAAQEISEPVQSCLNALQLNAQDVLFLHLAGFNLSEIAQILGVPYGTAGGRLHRARQGMQRCLASRRIYLVQPGSELPPGTAVVMSWQDELLVQLNEVELGRAGYRIVPAGGALPPGARIVVMLPPDERLIQ
jgi:RNA polymerase sigma factor (sigma-70 family)